MSTGRARLLAAVGACALGVAGLGAGCSSDSSPTSPPKIASAVADRDVVDGKARLSSTITVTFDRQFEIAEEHTPFASAFEFSVPLAEGGSDRVLVRSAERSKTNTRIVTLKTDRLIPEGATLKVERRAFQLKATGTTEAKVQADLDARLVLLASKALASTSDAFVGEAETAPVTAADRDAVAMRAALDQHMQARGSDAETKQDALDLFDALPAGVIPSPKLRAALAALTGTFAEPAIQGLLTTGNCTGRPVARILFQEPPGGAKLVARVTFQGDGARVISVNPFAEGERIEHLMPILAHEAIHCDQQDGLVEEVAATAFDGLLYLQLVAAQPELAHVKTRVARELNVDAVGLINSGARLPESIGILPSPGVKTILPLTNVTAASFAEFVVAAYPQITQPTSPTEPLAQVYGDVLAEVTGMKKGDAFDLRYLDELIGRAAMGPLLFGAILAFEMTPAG